MLRAGSGILLAITALLALIVGCNKPADSGISPQLQQQYLLHDEPTGAVGVLEAQQSETLPGELVLIGRVGAPQQEAFDQQRAMFVLSDPSLGAVEEHDHSEHGHGHGHDHDNCPFCQAKTVKGGPSPIARVQIVDQQGQVVPVSAQKLLGIEPNQLVVVQGTGHVDALGQLVVDARGIYVRQ